jgi:hypothetical protein
MCRKAICDESTDAEPLDAMYELMEAGVLEEIQRWKCGRSRFAA